MKQLQNEYTTPEQSKRLMELGLPRWSADEYRDQKGNRHSLEGILDVELFFQNFPDNLPCWSVGRLMEIFDMCYSEKDISEKWENHNALYKGQTYMDYIMYVYEHNYMFGNLNFSKLED